MEIKIEKIYVRNIPILLIFHENFEKAKEKGTIFFYHGLLGSKEVHFYEHEFLAKSGFLVIAVDSYNHGERFMYNICEKSTNMHEFLDMFLEIVINTTNENRIILDYLLNKNIIYQNNIGICGISMGGYIGYNIVKSDKRYKALASIVGSPYWTHNHKEAPYFNFDKFYPIKILSQNAGKDRSVNPKYTKEFHENLKEHYKNNPEFLKYIEYPESEHIMREVDWHNVLKNIKEWFDKFI